MPETTKQLRAMLSAADKARLAATEKADAWEIRGKKAERQVRDVAADRDRWARRAKLIEHEARSRGYALSLED